MMIYCDEVSFPKVYGDINTPLVLTRTLGVAQIVAVTNYECNRRRYIWSYRYIPTENDTLNNRTLKTKFRQFPAKYSNNERSTLLSIAIKTFNFDYGLWEIKVSINPGTMCI